jgi:uncharacterized membrane protein
VAWYWHALLAAGVYSLRRRRRPTGRARPSAEDVLDERYALGEIDGEEYRQCRVTVREQRRRRRS